MWKYSEVARQEALGERIEGLRQRIEATDCKERESEEFQRKGWSLEEDRNREREGDSGAMRTGKREWATVELGSHGLQFRFLFNRYPIFHILRDVFGIRGQKIITIKKWVFFIIVY